MKTRNNTPKKMLWAGRIVGGLVVLFLLFDGISKVLRLGPAVEGTVALGYPGSTVFGIGLTLLVCTILYAVPRTAVLGAVGLTGYLGGATAAQVRVEDPWFLFPVFLGVLAWVGLLLRDGRLHAFAPWRRAEVGSGGTKVAGV